MRYLRPSSGGVAARPWWCCASNGWRGAGSPGPAGPPTGAPLLPPLAPPAYPSCRWASAPPRPCPPPSTGVGRWGGSRAGEGTGTGWPAREAPHTAAPGAPLRVAAARESWSWGRHIPATRGARSQRKNTRHEVVKPGKITKVRHKSVKKLLTAFWRRHMWVTRILGTTHSIPALNTYAAAHGSPRPIDECFTQLTLVRPTQLRST